MFKRLISALGFNVNKERDSSLQETPLLDKAPNRPHNQAPRAKTDCYVCQSPLPFPEPVQVDTRMECPRCGILNVVTNTGRTNRPERLEIYKRYNGDLYDRSNVGLVGELYASIDAELKDLRDKKKQNLVDLKDYKRSYAQICRRREKMLAELDAQKNAELHGLRVEEKAIRKKLDIKNGRSAESISSSDITL